MLGISEVSMRLFHSRDVVRDVPAWERRRRDTRGLSCDHEDAIDAKRHRETQLEPRSPDAVRTAPKSKNKPPTAIIPGDESHQQSEGASTPQNAASAPLNKVDHGVLERLDAFFDSKRFIDRVVPGERGSL